MLADVAPFVSIGKGDIQGLSAAYGQACQGPMPVIDYHTIVLFDGWPNTIYKILLKRVLLGLSNGLTPAKWSRMPCRHHDDHGDSLVSRN